MDTHACRQCDASTGFDRYVVAYRTADAVLHRHAYDFTGTARYKPDPSDPVLRVRLQGSEGRESA